MARIDDVATIVRNPDFFPYRYDPSNDAIQFVKIPREAHRAAAFLRDEYLPDTSILPLGREESLQVAPTGAPIHYIFHSAYCCSTLLARAFDVPGKAMGLKEPLILNDMVGWNHRGADRTQLVKVLDQSLRLLARPFQPGEATIIKPSNIVNGLIPAMLQLRPESRALFLYAPLDRYLPSIAKKGLEGRLWVRTLMLSLVKEGRVDLGFENENYLELSDLQVAAVGWIAQHAQFLGLIEAYGAGRIATLDSEVLLANPEAAMTALDRLFGTGIGTEQAARIVAGPAFNENSKTFETYGTERRDAEKAAASAAHADEIGWVMQWATKLAEANAIPLDLPAGLLTRA
jgi:hypothetical protein